MKEYLNKLNRGFVIEISILALLSIVLIVFVWFKEEFVIWGVDTALGNSNPILRLQSSFFIWKDKINLGYAWPDQGTALYYLPLAALQYLGFSLKVQQMMLITSALFLTLVAGWYFGLVFLSRKAEDYLTRFSTALFYAFNIVTVTWIWWRFLSWILFYPIFLILFTLIYQAFSESKKDNISQSLGKIIFIVLFSLVFAPAFTSLIAFALLIGAVLFLTGFFILFDNINRAGVRTHLGIGSLICVLILCINAFQIVPQIAMIRGVSEFSEQSTTYTSAQVLQDASQYTPVLNDFRLMGEHTIHQTFNGEYLYDSNWLELIDSSPLFILITFVPIFAIAISLIFKIDAKKNILFSLLAVIAVFLIKGASPPFGEIEMWASSLPLGVLFRHPYDKFIYLLIIPFVFFFGQIIKKTSEFPYGKAWSVGLLVSVTILGVYPLWIGTNILNNQDHMHGMKVSIPSDYEHLRELKTEGNWLQLPMQSQSGDSAYAWQVGAQLNSKSILDDYIYNPVIYQNSSDPSWPTIYKRINNGLSSQQNNEFENLLLDLNIGMILVNKDVDYKFMTGKLPFTSSGQITDFLDSDANLTKILDEKSYALYRLNNYTDRTFILSNNIGTDLSHYYSVRYTKVSPVEYAIGISVNNTSTELNATTLPINLIFNQGYNSGWTLAYNQGYFSAASLNLKNSWIVQLPTSEKTLKLSLYFKPQRTFYISIFITLATLTLLPTLFFRKRLSN